MHTTIQQTFLTSTKLFASPPNFSMTEVIAYITPFPEDYVSGAMHNSYNYRWT